MEAPSTAEALTAAEKAEAPTAEALTAKDYADLAKINQRLLKEIAWLRQHQTLSQILDKENKRLRSINIQLKVDLNACRRYMREQFERAETYERSFIHLHNQLNIWGRLAYKLSKLSELSKLSKLWTFLTFFTFSNSKPNPPSGLADQQISRLPH